ncbi:MULTISPECIES: hypothetical protein [unclassified Pseudomonas]|uniref:hypothetical protein n=1 Tax=unclassified Pseudomonas TaxID=196821 RepID=UPI00244CD0CA|nr:MULTISPECIES: hypothetical protein [unclassified Pseudomonas]MDG9928492.1 hypothetical protein [Pseudomonas sp. GD04042]MDH0482662.1 hypothetical protein [Pseudomonas sp. GD04015]MDH0604636.1 hypothetical protein [Pseudomonas sp. GD03869]
MGLNRPTQQLRSELRDMAFQSENACVDLWRIAQALPDAQALPLLQVAISIQATADRLTALADRVRAGNIAVAKSNGGSTGVGGG